MIKVTQIKQIAAHSAAIVEARYAPSGEYVATASLDNYIIIWETQVRGNYWD
jgi:WD40 repeat protein